jgi:hypothetical protein
MQRTTARLLRDVFSRRMCKRGIGEVGGGHKSRRWPLRINGNEQGMSGQGQMVWVIGPDVLWSKCVGAIARWCRCIGQAWAGRRRGKEGKKSRRWQREEGVRVPVAWPGLAWGGRGRGHRRWVEVVGMEVEAPLATAPYGKVLYVVLRLVPSPSST